MLRKISIVTTLIIIHINIFVAGSYVGYFGGYNNGYGLYEKCKDLIVRDDGFSYTLIGFQVPVYLDLYRLHLLLVLPLIVLLAGKFLKREKISQGVCLVSLICVLAGYIFSYIQKLAFVAKVDFADEEISRQFLIMKETAVIDQICLGLLSLLFVYQIVTLVWYIRQPKQPKSF